MQEAITVEADFPADDAAARAAAVAWLVERVSRAPGAWEIEALDGPVVGARAVRQGEGDGVAAELLRGPRGWSLWVTTFSAAGARASGLAGWVLVHGLAAAAAVLVWRVAPLSFQLAGPLALITFAGGIVLGGAFLPDPRKPAREAEAAARSLLRA